MPPAAKKRKTRAASKTEEHISEATASQTDVQDESSARSPVEPEIPIVQDDTTTTQPSNTTVTPSAASLALKARQEKLRSLKMRSQSSSKSNMKEASLEASRLATDPTILANLSRKQATASHKLLKADTELAGEDFERKRAWDWTIEESEAWDKRMAEKEAARDDQAFQDYRQDANKTYRRQLGVMDKLGALDKDNYEKQKMQAMEKAAASGNLELVETQDGELVAIDKNGTFYSSSNSTGFVENKPEKAAVDRLVKDLEKAEEARLKKQRERNGKTEDGDVTYINDKNRQFNQKLDRFYNKYTSEIRDSFERGTAI